MEVNPITAQETQDQFLQLLVTQLQNQDPLEPIKQEDFLSQLAQFSTLQGVEDLNSSIEQQIQMQEEGMRFQELAQAASLVGSNVKYSFENEDGDMESRYGTVDRVQQNLGRVELRIGDDTVGWDAIEAVGDVQDPSSLAGGSSARSTTEAVVNISNAAQGFAP